MTMQDIDFANRIARIESGLGSTKSTIFVGLDESFVYHRKPKTQPKPGGVSNLIYPLSVLAAFVMGFAAQLSWRLMDFVWKGLPDPNADPDFVLLTDATMSLVIAIALGQVLRLNHREHVTTNLLGVLAGLCGFHNLVHANPQLFEALFSHVYVQDILNRTQEFSLYWRGVTFAL